MPDQHLKPTLLLQSLVILLVSLSVHLLAGCNFTADTESSAGQQSSANSSAGSQASSTESKLATINELADLLHHQAIADSRLLNEAIHKLTEYGEENHLAQTKNAWLKAHASLTTLWAIYQAPGLWENLHKTSGPYSVYSLLDATPVIAGYLDAVPGYPGSGLISALDIPVNTASLVAKHQFSDHHFVVFGLHPMEFFLWQAPIAKLTASNTDNPKQAIHHSRRKAFLKLVGGEYENQLIALHRRWQQQKLATTYFDNPQEPGLNPRQIRLTALITYLDRFLTAQLQTNPEGTRYLFAEHFQFSTSATSFWQPVLQGIKVLMKLNNLTDISPEVFPEPLYNCLKEVTIPNKNNHTRHCSKEILALKTSIILSFNSANPG